MGELPADDGPDLRRLPGRGAEPVEPGQQRGVERSRDRRRRRRACGTRLEHRLGQLLGEQRHPVRALHDLGHDGLGQSGPVRDPPHERRRLAPAEAVEHQGRHVRPAGPGRREVGAEGDQQQDRQTGRALDREVEQLARARVDPVHVLEDHQRRPARRLRLELAQQRREGPLAPALRGGQGRGVAVAGRQRQQLGQEGHVLRGRRGRRQQRLQLGEPRLGRVAAREPGRALEPRDHRVERAVPVVRRAEVAQGDVPLLGQVLLEGGEQPRLADPGLAGQQDDPALAALGLLPAAPQQGQLLLAPDQRRQRRAAWSASERLATAPAPRTR